MYTLTAGYWVATCQSWILTLQSPALLSTNAIEKWNKRTHAIRIEIARTAELLHELKKATELAVGDRQGEIHELLGQFNVVISGEIMV